MCKSTNYLQKGKVFIKFFPQIKYFIAFYKHYIKH